MAGSAVTIEHIKSNLAKLPADKLQEINDFVEFVLQKSKPKAKNIIKLEGIWKGLGFEKIHNIEDQIKELRHKSDKMLSSRISKWNI